MAPSRVCDEEGSFKASDNGSVFAEVARPPPTVPEGGRLAAMNAVAELITGRFGSAHS